MTWLLNCRNCSWHITVDNDLMQADYLRDCHEESIRNALSTGPYCPRSSVTIKRLPQDAKVPS